MIDYHQSLKYIIPLSGGFVQRLPSFLGLCKKLIQTKMVFLFLFKLNRPTTPLTTICASKYLVRLLLAHSLLK